MLEKELKFIDRFFYHTRAVQDNMILLENQLNELDFLNSYTNTNINNYDILLRSIAHDTDKIQNNLIENYIFLNNYYQNLKKDLPIDYINLNQVKDNIKIHYKTQRHHFYTNGIIPNTIDLCEMCSDVDAVSNELNEKNNTEYFTTQMMVKYPILTKYKDNIIKLFNILNNKQIKVKDDKYYFISKIIKYIRALQDCRIFLEKNSNLLPIKLEKWELIRNGVKSDLDNLFNTLNMNNNNHYNELYNKIINYNKTMCNNENINLIENCCRDYINNKNNNINNNYNTIYKLLQNSHINSQLDY